MSTKVPDQTPRAEEAIRSGVTNELPPERTDPDPVRRRDDLTIRGADPKELSTPRQISKHLGRQTK